MLPAVRHSFTLMGLGQFAIIMAAFCYGLSSVWGKRLKDYPAEVNAFGMLSCSTLFLLPFVLLFERDLPQITEMTPVFAVIALALFSTICAYLLYFRILLRAGAVNLVLVTFFIPMTTILFGYLLLDEVMTLPNLLGMCLIFVSLVFIDGRLVANRKKKERLA